MFVRLYLSSDKVGANEPCKYYSSLGSVDSLQLDGPRQCKLRRLPDTSAHDQHWESNPRLFDIDYNALSLLSCAPTVNREIDQVLRNTEMHSDIILLVQEIWPLKEVH